MTDNIDYSNKILVIKNYLENLQENIFLSVKKHESQKAIVDHWTSKLGAGTSIAIENGNVIERAGINLSIVKAEKLPKSATLQRPELINSPFQAMGVSVVIHPNNPFIPTSHMNVRFFLITPKDKKPLWWFGGGFDLTPYYPFNEDCVYWHQEAKKACDILSTDAYTKYKQWADTYFYLKHRQETRGIGGIFFDDLNQFSFNHCFEFMRAVGNNYTKAYENLISKRKNTPFSQEQKEFQTYRRGRYVEFNLLYDRGTKFGLENNGRTESILLLSCLRVT
jgi:coproporphyrinogen III oxidase